MLVLNPDEIVALPARLPCLPLFYLNILIVLNSNVVIFVGRRAWRLGWRRLGEDLGLFILRGTYYNSCRRVWQLKRLFLDQDIFLIRLLYEYLVAAVGQRDLVDIQAKGGLERGGL